MHELTGQVRSLQDVIHKQRNEMRAVEKDLAIRNTELEVVCKIFCFISNL